MQAYFRDKAQGLQMTLVKPYSLVVADQRPIAIEGLQGFLAGLTF